ncbi:MAG: hypothetical protein N4A57_02860 [Anaeromicrobium sp.]|jgi:hypothetical protein|uniref:hypothetical protein n=1 Tax=Anaeromicrobium sp. TaxID=1929132 RepID=UPI0025F1F21B|nr:hypothetical protein [Anaeromicrobium sp.]MCT4593202.1 hypothetical protein [Anaeromicrobium sp.]
MNDFKGELYNMYPAIGIKGYWENQDGLYRIKEMDELWIKNTINMLKNKNGINLTSLEKWIKTDRDFFSSTQCKNLEKAIELIRTKIEDLEDHLNAGLYKK